MDTITLEELQWQGVGWDKLTDELRLSVLEDRLAQCAWGVIQLSPDQIRATQVLLNKYRGDKKAVELSGPNGGAIKIEGIKVELVRPDAT
jgi:hypothetical protein